MSMKLILGDCLEKMKGLSDNSVDAVITDPVWNVGKDYGTYKDNLSYADYTKLIRQLKAEWERVAQGRVAVVLGSEILKQWWDEFPKAKIIIVRLGEIVMTKRNNMHLQWKAILTTCASNDFTTDLWEDIRWPGEGYFFNEPRYGHPAMTPLKLMKRLVSLFTKEGNTVLEPFAGTGTTVVACQELNRNCTAIEIDPIFYATMQKRVADAQKQPSLPFEYAVNQGEFLRG